MVLNGSSLAGNPLKSDFMGIVEDKLNAYRHYTEAGIIVHPLSAPVMGDRATGKSPTPKGWSDRKEPYAESFMKQEIEKGCNLGILCGKCSNITILDIDWYVPGIEDMLFNGLDVSGWCRQKHGEGLKGHIIFNYNPLVRPGLNQDLGFDLLTQNRLGGGANCVCAPSIHADGSVYRMNRDITERTDMPDLLAERINQVVELYEGLQGVLMKCRKVWRMFWRAVFTDKQSEYYHYVQAFRGPDGRIRHLGLFAELKVNGATNDMLMLACAMIFGDDYDLDKCKKEIRNVGTKTMKNETISCDSILSKFYTPKEFNPMDIQVTELEKRLDADTREVYEDVLLNTPYEAFEAVQKAFLIGHFTR